MENKKNPIKTREIFGLLSFFFGIITVVIEFIFLVNAISKQSITGLNFFGDYILAILTFFLPNGGYFLLTFLGVIFGLIGLNSSKRKLAKQGIILSLVGFLFYLVLTIALFSNSLG